MLEKEYEYFESIRDELVKEHLNEYVAIQDQKVIGYYKKKDEALSELSGKYEIGTFLIQQCIPEDTETQVFHSRVVI